MSAILQAVAMFVASFPQNTTTAEIFAAQMGEDVQSWQPHPFEIEEAFRALRLSKKFLPSIAEVHAAWKAASDKWSDRWDANDSCEGLADELAKLIEHIEAEQERKRLEREAREREREERDRQWRENQEAAKRERDAAENYLATVNDWKTIIRSMEPDKRAEFKQFRASSYQPRIDALLEAAGEDLNLGSRHHEACTIFGDGKVCDCVPALWAITEPTRRIFLADADGQVHPILTLAEAKALAVGQRKRESA
jgi:hypothetical protein